jgi:hypothetical protein
MPGGRHRGALLKALGDRCGYCVVAGEIHLEQAWLFS